MDVFNENFYSWKYLRRPFFFLAGISLSIVQVSRLEAVGSTLKTLF